MNNLRTSPPKFLQKPSPPIFFMVHLLHRLYGVDAPVADTDTQTVLSAQAIFIVAASHCVIACTEDSAPVVSLDCQNVIGMCTTVVIVLLVLTVSL